MYKELELWKLMLKTLEIYKTVFIPNSTECGSDFREFECNLPNEDGMKCNQYPLCLRSKKLGEFQEMLEDEQVHISALEAERELENPCRQETLNTEGEKK